MSLEYMKQELIESLGSVGLFFVQIGANDGIIDDALREWILKYKWKGVLVEPLPDVFEQLKKNYIGHDGLVYVNAAITEKDGPVKFFRHNMSVCSGLGIKTRIQKRGKMKEIEVEGITMGTLFREYVTQDIDVMAIDVEGFDGVLVRSIPLEVRRPKIIRYEHKHLSTEERGNVADHLMSNGYDLIIEKDDTVAFDSSVFK